MGEGGNLHIYFRTAIICIYISGQLLRTTYASQQLDTRHEYYYPWISMCIETSIGQVIANRGKKYAALAWICPDVHGGRAFICDKSYGVLGM